MQTSRDTFLNRVAGGLIIVAALSRLLPHPPNFAPITAMAVFSGWMFPSYREGLVVVLASMLISDIGLALVNAEWSYLLHSMLPVIYGTFAVIIALARWLAIRRTFIRGVLSLAAGSAIFFIVTNFFVWLLGSMYPLTFEGLLTCYAMAVPFYHVNGLAPFELIQNAFIGDVFYGVLLFCLYYGAQKVAALLDKKMTTSHTIGG